MANNAQNSACKSVADWALVQQELEAQGVRHVRLIIVSLSNIVRGKVVPIARFFKLFGSGNPRRGINMAKAVMSLPMYMDVFLDGLPNFLYQVGEMELLPELETIRKLPYSTHTHAICHVTLHEKEVTPAGLLPDFELCPRSCLKRVVRAAEEAGVTFLVGFESEVIFLETTNPPTAVNRSSYLRLSAFDSVTHVEMVDEIVEALEAQGIGVAQYHAEGAPGQYEFVTDPYQPVEAVDALVLTRQTILNIALKYNCRATFAPKVFLNSGGTGSHVHISVHRRGGSSSSSPGCPAGMTGDEEAFLAGILKHLRCISALLMSSTNSYLRIGEGTLTGVHIGWGLDNREAPVRLAFSPSAAGNPTRSKDYRFEVRSLDATANPYLALAAVLSAGFHDGIKNKLRLASKELKVNPAKLSEEERRAHGVTERMPSSLQEALEALNLAPDFLVNCIGPTLLEVFKVMKAEEAVYMDSLDPEKQIQVHIANY